MYTMIYNTKYSIYVFEMSEAISNELKVECRMRNSIQPAPINYDNLLYINDNNNNIITIFWLNARRELCIAEKGTIVHRSIDLHSMRKIDAFSFAPAFDLMFLNVQSEHEHALR